MKFKKILFILLLLVVFVLNIQSGNRIRYSVNEPLRLEAEKEIYSLLLPDEISEFPIAEYTTLGKFDKEVLEDDFLYSFYKFPAIKQEIIVDFKNQNKQSYSIRDYLPSSINEHLINQQGWWISFSRIGFDSFFTQAVVLKEEYAGCDENGDCELGRGIIFFIQKIDGKWVIQSEIHWWLMEAHA